MRLLVVVHALLAVACMPVLAAEAPQACVAHKPVAATAWVARVIEKATALTRQRRDADAAKVYRDYLEKQPNDSAALVAYAAQLMILRDGAGAQAVYERVLALPERKRTIPLWQVHAGLAGALYAQQKYGEVVLASEKALGDPCAKPGLASWGIYASSLFLDRRVEDAARVATVSVAHGSRDWLTLMVAIEAQASLKQYEDAARIAILAARDVVLASDARALLADSVRILAEQEPARVLLAEAQAQGLFDAQWYPQKSGPQTVEQLIPLYAYSPLYPREAARRGIEGWVDVLITIDQQGKVHDAAVFQAEPAKIFDQAALEAAHKSGFRPVVIDGQASVVRGVRRYNFELDR